MISSYAKTIHTLSPGYTLDFVVTQAVLEWRIVKPIDPVPPFPFVLYQEREGQPFLIARMSPQHQRIWSPSTAWDDAYLVVQAMQQRGYSLKLQASPVSRDSSLPTELWFATFYKYPQFSYESSGENAALAICRTALLATQSQLR